MSLAGTTLLVEAPQPPLPLAKTKVSGGGGAVLNPEASVFQLPPTPGPPSPTTPGASTPTTPPTPIATPTTINGYHVYPLMNGDVGKQTCGVCPHTPDTPGTMVVDPAVEAEVSQDASGVADQPTQELAKLADADDGMAAAGQCAEQEGGGMAPAPLDTSQQNGEVSSEECRPSASPLPAPVATPDSSSSEVSPPEPVEELEKTTEEGAAEEAKEGASSETQATQTTPAQTPTPTAQPQQLTRDQIQQLVAQEVEYFFSRENLSNDPYLISQMDSDQYVPVYILADCSQFKSITKDHSIIVEALKESPYVQLDEENNRVRPNYKRCIVILREIPESTPVEEIEAMFKSEECPKVVSCEFVHNSSWYVTFESDDDAQKAYWYLRGVVKTFKDKPIRARIKTKPVSRLGCLSVLPSYGGKSGGGEGKEGATSGTPTSAASGASVGSGNAHTPSPNANFNTPGGQRFLYSSTPNTITANSYTYSSFTTPTAYFYPNMVQWTAPGGFYDINGFLQFNGLSPTAAFKPPSNPNVRYNNNRRNSKHRENRYDKNDNRHSGGGGGNGNSNHQNQYPHYSQRSHHRPQASQSPSLHRSSQTPAGNIAPPPPPPPLPSQPAPASAAGSNNQSFAQCDLAIASQSSLYTSFSPPMGPATPVQKSDKKEVVTVSKASSSSSPSSPPVSTCPGMPHPATATSPATSTSMLNSTASSTSPATTFEGCASPPAPDVGPTPVPPMLHPGAQMHPMAGPPHHHHHGPPGPPHRGFNNDHYHYHHHHHAMARDPQPPRQFFKNWLSPRSRGGRRRMRGRDEDAQGGGRGPPQRGHMGQPPSSEKTAVLQDHLPPPPPPQFDLEAAAFPPLPGADEQVPVAEEKKQTEPVASPWGSDTHRFSDVMKGTAKPRAASQSSVGEKDLPADSVIPSSSSSPGPAAPVTSVPAAPTPPTPAAAATIQTSQASTTTACSQSTPDVPSISTVTATNTASSTTTTPSSSSSSTTVTSSIAITSTTASSSSSSKSDSRPAPREQRTGQDHKRNGPNGSGMKERREFPREHQREYRESGRTAAGRDRDHRIARDTNPRTGKENRPVPVPVRQYKEEKMDADGWITKTPRESRAQREMRQEAREARPQHLVNGDSTPPPSPKPQKTDSKASIKESSGEESKVSSQSLNNNDGEHKTSWAKMALASKDHMERLAAELKEKEEQEKIKKMRLNTRPQAKTQEKVLVPREREGKALRREGAPRENRLSGEMSQSKFRPRDSARPKSPK